VAQMTDRDSTTTKLFPAQNYEPIFREIEGTPMPSATTPCGRCVGGTKPRDNQTVQDGTVVGCLRCYDTGVEPTVHQNTTTEVLDKLRCSDGVMGSPTVRYHLDMAIGEIVRLHNAVRCEDRRERAIQAAIIEMSTFTGNPEMKIRAAIDRYEFILGLGENGN
jgi:hypothetical protein